MCQDRYYLIWNYLTTSWVFKQNKQKKPLWDDSIFFLHYLIGKGKYLKCIFYKSMICRLKRKFWNQTVYFSGSCGLDVNVGVDYSPIALILKVASGRWWDFGGRHQATSSTPVEVVLVRGLSWILSLDTAIACFRLTLWPFLNKAAVIVSHHLHQKRNP